MASAEAGSFKHRAGIVRQVLGDRRERGLVVRMLVWRLIVSTLKHIVPIRRLVAIAGSRSPRRAALPTRERIIELARLACRPRLNGPRDNCLDRSLIAYRYLRAAGDSPSLVVGFGRAGDALRGHAWLVINGEEVGEPHTTHEDFGELVRFAADGLMMRT